MFRVQMLVIPFLLLTNVGLGQAGTSSDQETIRLLVQQVHELQDRVKALEATQSGSKSAAAQPAEEQAEESADSTQSQPTTAMMHELGGIQWRGFGEVNYKVLDQREPELSTFGFVPGSAGNFYTGEFALFLTSVSNVSAISILSTTAADGS